MRTIIADSGCDLTPELRDRLGVLTVPLTLRVEDNDYVDNDTLDVSKFMSNMKTAATPAQSSAPSPGQFQDAFEQAGDDSIAIVLSSKLSATHDAAVAGLMLAHEEHQIDAHVIDSKSASAGETLAVVKLREFITSGLSTEQIITSMQKFVAGMKTYFVLERYDNLIRSGRISRLTERLLKLMHLRLICGDDGDGNIALHDKSSDKKLLDKLVGLIQHAKRPTEGENLVISHCHNPGFAARLAEAVSHFNFREIFIVPTCGLASMYADEQGVVFAF